MQTREQIIEHQSFFSKKHITLLVTLLLYFANNIISGNKAETIDYIKCTVICTFLILDVTAAYFSFFHNYILLTIYKMTEVAGCCFLIGDVGASGHFTIVDTLMVVFYCMYMVESLFLFDLTDGGKRLVACIVCQIGFVVKIALLGVKMLYGMNTDILNYLILAAVSTIICYSISCVYGKMEDYYDSCIFAKNRLLERAKDNSEKIAESQKTMMLTNEQLGIKKFELEEAYKKINSVNANINLQNRFMRMMMSSFNLSEITREMRSAFMENMDIKYAGLIFKDESVERKNPNGIREMFSEEEYMEFNDFFLSYAFIHEHKDVGHIFIDNEISYEEFPFFKSNNVKSMAAKTIEGESEENTCVYVLFGESVDAFAGKETLLDNVFGQMEVVLNNISLYSKVQDMSVRDGLTGLYNRRYLNIYFNENFVDRKVGHSVVLAMLDIDHFKNINDTYGHLFGDQAIRTVSSKIKECAKKYDSRAFRYGGEEFVIIFDDFKLEEVVDIMEELRISIKSTDIANEQYTIRCNVSIGVSQFPDITSDIHTLVDRSDRAMYYSKQHGRDRITVDDGTL